MSPAGRNSNISNHHLQQIDGQAQAGPGPSSYPHAYPYLPQPFPPPQLVHPIPQPSSSSTTATTTTTTDTLLTSATKAVKLALFDVTSRAGEARCGLCEEYTSTAKEGILMYHVMGKKDHVKSRHAMCRRYDDWGEDPYWEEVYARIAGFIASKPGTEGLVSPGFKRRGGSSG